MAELNPGSKPRLARKARLRYEEVRKAELLLLPERVVKLNATGAAILRLCDGGRTVRDIIMELETRYAKSGLQSEVMEFLRRVSDHGWVEFYE
jgi:pyrroloquinoline quinone biosynthesis protein D